MISKIKKKTKKQGYRAKCEANTASSNDDKDVGWIKKYHELKKINRSFTTLSKHI